MQWACHEDPRCEIARIANEILTFKPSRENLGYAREDHGHDISRRAATYRGQRRATFNLRFASTNKPNSWVERRPAMRVCIAEMAPDVMGTQEGVYPQLKDVAADLPGYEWIGLGRDGGSRGEFMATFYRKKRLEPPYARTLGV